MSVYDMRDTIEYVPVLLKDMMASDEAVHLFSTNGSGLANALKMIFSRARAPLHRLEQRLLVLL